MQAEGLLPWVHTAAYCEIEEKSRDILLSRMARGEIDCAPVWDDVRTLRGGHVSALDIEIISGGFPCQSHSVAGKRKGLSDDRGQLVWEVFRLTDEIKPAFIFLENVWPGIRKLVPWVRNQIEGLGFEVRDGILASRDCGFKHRRERWFLAAYSHKNAIQIEQRRRPGASRPRRVFSSGNVEAWFDAYASKTGCERGRRPTIGNETALARIAESLESDDWNAAAGEFLRMDVGRSHRNFSIGALGDSVPPIQVRKAFGLLTGFMQINPEILHNMQEEDL